MQPRLLRGQYPPQTPEQTAKSQAAVRELRTEIVREATLKGLKTAAYYVFWPIHTPLRAIRRNLRETLYAILTIDNDYPGNPTEIPED